MKRNPLPAAEDPRLTDRQAEIVHLALKGHGNLAIAEALGIEEDTVKKQIQFARDRTGLR